jgi:Fe-S-cluster containining protein
MTVSLAAPPCEICRGACCESLLIPAFLIVDSEWAQARGLKRARASAWEVGLPCAKLSPLGGCSIYESRPMTCRNYQLGGYGCSWALERRRSRENREAVLAALNEQGISPASKLG